MPKPNLLCPVNTIESAKAHIRMGADEVYVGLLLVSPFEYSFSGRANGSSVKVNPEFSELKDIVSLCKDNGVTVNFAANKPFITNDYDGGTRGFSLFCEYVSRGLEAGADNLIIGSIQNIRLLESQGISAPIHCSVFNGAFNEEHVRILAENGSVRRVVLPYNILLSEIADLVAKFPDVEFEVFGHLGCSNLNAQCRLIHNFGEKEYLGLPCRNRYRVSENGSYQQSCAFMDTGLDCSICSVGILSGLGVHTLKIVGRDIDYRFVAGITKMYRQAIDMYAEGKEPREVRESVLRQIPQYEKVFCAPQRCKYKASQNLYAYYV